MSLRLVEVAATSAHLSSQQVTRRGGAGERNAEFGVTDDSEEKQAVVSAPGCRGVDEGSGLVVQAAERTGTESDVSKGVALPRPNRKENRRDTTR